MKHVDVSAQVDTGVPIPVNGRLSLPLRDMNVGDSIEFPLTKRPNVASRATILKKKEGLEFTIRKMSESTCRIWRTK